MKTKSMILCIAVTLTAMLAGCKADAVDGMDEIDRKVDELYAKMSLEECVAQLRSMYMDSLFDENLVLDPERCASIIPNGIGHFSQFASQHMYSPDTLRDMVAQVQRWLMENTPNGIPALFHEEVLSGVNTRDATVYPQQIGQACSFNPQLAELKTWQTADDMRRMGGVLSLSPMVDVCRTPSFNRLEESYGEDGYLSAVMGTAFVRGLQQGDLKHGVGTCSKHYLGYGGGGDADEKELMEEILLPHETMIRLAGSDVVMTGYHSVHGINCVASSEIIEDILRGYIGFKGMMVSDYTSIDQIIGLEDPVHRAAAAINAGNDVDFPHGANYAYLPEALSQGLVKPEMIERAVKKVLRHKFLAGLFDENPYLYAEGHITLDSLEERQTAYDIAVQSVVLLQNDGVLPLDGDRRIFLTGPNANSMWAMCGDYSAPAMSYFWKMADVDAEHPHIVGLKEGMEARKPAGCRIDYSRGCDWTEEIETVFLKAGDERAWDYDILHRKVDSGEKADLNEALQMAAQSDVIVAAVGENVMLCGENRDRMGLKLPGLQEQFVEKLIATGKPVVLVVFGGHAQVISGVSDRCAAVIQAWYPGEEGGTAVADILFGNVSPSAKLSVSYPNVELYEPICYNYSAGQDPRIAWPFGFGLSYTTFEYSNLNIPESTETVSDSISLSFQVTNTGDIKADEVVQLYLSPTDDSQPIRPLQLQGFARVRLEPGETRTVHMALRTEQFGYYSNDGQRQWNIAPGSYIVKIAASSTDIRLQQTVSLTGQKVVKPLRDYYFSTSFVE